MESDYKKLKPKLSIELEQENPPQKKSLWQKIKDLHTQRPEGESSEDWRNRE